MKSKPKVTLFHFGCDRHEVEIAHGYLSEILLLGPVVVNRMTAPERKAVIDLLGTALKSAVSNDRILGPKKALRRALDRGT